MPDDYPHLGASDRRGWLTTCIRCLMAGALLLTAGVLARRRLNSRCVHVGLACSECVQRGHCSLPPAIDYRHHQRM
jgi:hypothetical protein